VLKGIDQLLGDPRSGLRVLQPNEGGVPSSVKEVIPPAPAYVPLNVVVINLVRVLHHAVIRNQDEYRLVKDAAVAVGPDQPSKLFIAAGHQPGHDLR